MYYLVDIQQIIYIILTTEIFVGLTKKKKKNKVKIKEYLQIKRQLTKI